MFKMSVQRYNLVNISENQHNRSHVTHLAASWCPVFVSDIYLYTVCAILYKYVLFIHIYIYIYLSFLTTLPSLCFALQRLKIVLLIFNSFNIFYSLEIFCLRCFFCFCFVFLTLRCRLVWRTTLAFHDSSI